MKLKLGDLVNMIRHKLCNSLGHRMRCDDCYSRLICISFIIAIINTYYVYA